MQVVHVVMFERTYRGVSRIAKEYFLMLVGQHHELHGTYDVMPEEDRAGAGETFTISLSGQRTYALMQKVFRAENG